MALTKRLDKGQALTAAEHDANIDDLNDRPDGQVYPKESGIGVKIDNASPDWGWHDLLGEFFLEGGVDDPSWEVYQGSIKQLQFSLTNAYQVDFHLPHDYAPGTDIYIHCHWSHNSAAVTTGSVTWQTETMYSKGHNQAFFSTPVLVNMTEAANPIRYQHMTTESQLSASAGAGGLLVTEDLEVDGLVITRLSLSANTMDGGALPFLHRVDIHYQSTTLSTKNKSPNFYGA